MSYANGRIPPEALGDIPGDNAGLLKDAARAYTAMAAAAAANGVSLAIADGSVGRTYRSLQRQYLAKATFGRNAAMPGTSNHGWALAVDLMNGQQRQWIDRHGAQYGWAKKWSDAAWEWWHVKWRAGVYPAVEGYYARLGDPILNPGVKGPSVEKLQRLLRARGFASVPGQKQDGYGYYGKDTESAVKRVQREHRLRPDGVVGPKTWNLLT